MPLAAAPPAFDKSVIKNIKRIPGISISKLVNILIWFMF
jgi:hypothetical protein